MTGIQKLTARQIKNLKPKVLKGRAVGSRISDGGGLYLRMKASGSKSWSFMWKRDGYQREIALGPYHDVSLKIARQKARKAREALAMGVDPREALRPPEVHSFLKVAEKCLEARKLDEMNPKTKRKWERTAYEICKRLHNRPIESINRDDVLGIVEPIWRKTPETGRIVRAQMEIIFDYARSRRWLEGENPAKWKGGLDGALKPYNRKTAKHHAAMPYQDVPAFMTLLKARDAMSARALELLILTATRTTETIEAKFDEFNIDEAHWIIPAQRMKGGLEHIIPLSGRALEIVQEMHEFRRSEYVFPSRGKKPLSNNAMLTLLKKRMGYSDLTVHGFRSSFRDWAGNMTDTPREIAEAALSHAVGDATERAYRRQTALERRRVLMQRWADYCGGIGSGEIVRLHV